MSALRRLKHFVAVASPILAVVSSTSLPHHTDLHAGYSFETYERVFGKQYASAEEREKRAKIFASTLSKVLSHNSRTNSGYKMGLNYMSDWTTEEFKKSVGSDQLRAPSQYKPSATPFGSSASSLPSEVDWRACTPFAAGGALRDLCPLDALPAEPILTAPKIQGGCGACWAFSTTESVEAAYAIKYNRSRVLAPQQLVSCVHNFHACGGTSGCQGSDPALAMEYLMGNQKIYSPRRNASDLTIGLVDEWYYGFTSATAILPQFFGQSPADICRPDKIAAGASYHGQGAVALSSYEQTGNNYTLLMDMLANKGPPVVIFMVNEDLQHYESGIFDECGYGDQEYVMNHAVQMVGYGEEEGNGMYWTIRNSWGSMWGENGYFRITREDTESCVEGPDVIECGRNVTEPTIPICGCLGIASYALHPVIV